MPRGQPFGEEVYRPEVSPEAEPRKLVPEIRQAPLAAGVEAITGALGAKYQADSAAFAGDQLTDLRVSTIKALQDAKASVPAGDPGNFAGDFLKDFDKTAGDYVGRAGGNPVAASMLRRGVGQLRASLFEHATEWEARQRVAYQKDSLRTNLERQLPGVREHPEMADQVGQSLVEQANLSRLEPDEKLDYMRWMHSQLTRTAVLGLTDQNPANIYRQLLGDPSVKLDNRVAELDPQSRAEVLSAARSGVVNNFAEGALDKFRAGGPVAGSAALSAIDDLKLPGPKGEQDVMRDSIRAEIEKRRGALIAEQKQKYGPQIIGVEEQLRSRDPAPWTRGAIWSLYRNNAMDAHSTGAALGELDAAEQRAALGKADLAAVQSAWDGKTLLDPKSKEDKEAVYNWFDAFTKANAAPTGSQAWVNLGAEFARRTGVVPENIGEWARQVLVGSQDPKQVVSAVDAIERVRAASPRGFPYFDDDKRLSAMADQVAQLARNGTPAIEAIKMARETAARGDDERGRMDELWKAQRPFGPGDSALENVVRAQLGSDPRVTTPGTIYGRNLPTAIPPAMQGDYARSVRSYFNYNGGNLKQAEESAARDIGGSWGVSRVNGEPELMRFPPERVFPGLTVEDVRNDITETVKKHEEGFQRWDEEKHALAPFKVDPDKIHLVPVPGVTDLTGGREWGLMYEAEQEGGAPQVVYGKDQQPLHYALPVTKEDYGAVRARERAAAIERAEKEYQRITREQKDAYEQLARDAQATWGSAAVR